ncbi:MAG: M48 family metallopeptidase [Desulfovibrio sp.]|nr:M48 family metallopeptidase [Desulfovibrio sp.]
MLNLTHWLEDNIDKVPPIQAVTAKQTKTKPEKLPDSIDYTCQDGSKITIIIRKTQRLRRCKIRLINDQCELRVPSNLPLEALNKILPNVYTWIESNIPYLRLQAEIPRTLNYTSKTGKNIVIAVERSKRARNVRVKLQNNQFILVLPKSTGKEKLDKLLPDIFAWVEKKAPEVHEVQKMHSLPKLVSIPLLNTDFPINYVQEYPKDPLNTLDFDRNSIFSSVVNGQKKILVVNYQDMLTFYGEQQDLWLQVIALQRWCLLLAKKHLPIVLNRVLSQNHFQQVNCKVHDQRMRWGSCTKKTGQTPTIYLNWRAILLSEELISHLCLHEASHIIYMNHSAEFYDTLVNMDPDTLMHEKGLDAAWDELPWWATHKKQLNAYL